MATKANGEVVTPTSSFQYDVFSLANRAGLLWLPQGEVGFSEVSGLTDETDAVDYKEGNDLYPDKLPGQSKAIEVVLSKGLDKNNRLIRWRNAIKERTALPIQSARADLIISVYARQGVPGSGGDAAPELITQWKLKQAWPRMLELGDLNATSSEINVIKLTLCTLGPPEQLFPRIDR